MKLFIISILIAISSQIFAQQTNISGKITDSATGKPLSGASINVKGKLIGTITGEEGTFQLTVNKLKLPFLIN